MGDKGKKDKEKKVRQTKAKKEAKKKKRQLIRKLWEQVLHFAFLNSPHDFYDYFRILNQG